MLLISDDIFFHVSYAEYNMSCAVVTLVWQIPIKNVILITIAKNTKKKKEKTINTCKKSETAKVSQRLVCVCFMLFILCKVSCGISIKFINGPVARCISNVIFEAVTSLLCSCLASLFSLYIFCALFKLETSSTSNTYSNSFFWCLFVEVTQQYGKFIHYIYTNLELNTVKATKYTTTISSSNCIEQHTKNLSQRLQVQL